MLMKAFLYIIAFLWLGLFTYIGIDNYTSTPDIIERDTEFVATALTPKVDFVEEFRDSQGRLPTLEEFNSSLKFDLMNMKHISGWQDMYQVKYETK